MSSSSFPLLRLPLVAQTEIIGNIRLKQLVQLSLCSKRMHFVVRKYRNKSFKLELHLRAQRDSEIHIFHCEFPYSDALIIRVSSEDIAESWRTDRIGRKVVKFMETERELVTYWEDLVYGTKSTIDYMCHLFGVPVKTVRIAENITWPLDIVEERQGSFYDAFIDSPTISDEILRNILTNYNPSNLWIDSFSRGFQIENFHKTYDTFAISYGKWLTVDNLYTLDCKKIYCGCKKFNSAELNQYFKHVLAGMAPRLKLIRGMVDIVDENVILAGIQELLRPIPGKESFVSDDATWTLRGELDIRGSSVTVIVRCWKSDNRFELIIQ